MAGCRPQLRRLSSQRVTCVALPSDPGSGRSDVQMIEGFMLRDQSKLREFWAGRRVLVTGAAGFTGRNLANTLANIGADVTAFVRKGGSYAEFHPDVLEFQGDLTSKRDRLTALDDADTVFNLAAVFRQVAKGEEYLRSVHVDAPVQLLRLSKESGVRRFVHTSTIGVHGHVDGDAIDETGEFAPGDDYQRTKLEGELAVRITGDEIGMPWTVIRPCGIYGVGDTRFLKLVKPIARRHFVMIGSGDTHMHFTHVRDLVIGHLLAGMKDEALGESFFIGDERSIRLNELSAIIAKSLHVPRPTMHIPYAPIHAAAYACEMLFKPFGAEPPLHRRRVKFFSNNRSFKIDKAKARLGYQPSVPVRRGMAEMIDWYRSEGLI